MENNVLNLKNKKIFGILFLLLTISDVIYEIFQSALYNQEISGIYFLFWILDLGAKICATICLLKKYNNSSLVLLSVSMITAILVTITVFLEIRTISLIGTINIVAYAIIAAVLLSKNKRLKVATTVIFIDISVNAVLSGVLSLIQSYRVMNYQISYSVFNFGAIYFFDIAELFCILLYLWSIKPLATALPNTITVDSNVIDFKELLQFVENEYHSGNITEEEYTEKRNHILSKL